MVHKKEKGSIVQLYKSSLYWDTAHPAQPQDRTLPLFVTTDWGYQEVLGGLVLVGGTLRRSSVWPCAGDGGANRKECCLLPLL